MEKDYSKLRPGEKKILYSLLRKDLRYNALQKSTGIHSKDSFDKYLENLKTVGLVTKLGGQYTKTPYKLTPEGREVASKVNMERLLEEEVARDAGRRLHWIALEDRYHTIVPWQKLRLMLNRDFEDLLVHYAAKLYVRAVRTAGAASAGEALKRRVDRTWQIIDAPRQEELDQVFDWPEAVRETLAELDYEYTDAGGRHQKALQMVKTALEKYSDNLFQDIKDLVKNPVGAHLKPFKPLVITWAVLLTAFGLFVMLYFGARIPGQFLIVTGLLLAAIFLYWYRGRLAAIKYLRKRAR